MPVEMTPTSVLAGSVCWYTGASFTASCNSDCRDFQTAASQKTLNIANLHVLVLVAGSVFL